jgi:hypothetical protein
MDQKWVLRVGNRRCSRLDAYFRGTHSPEVIVIFLLSPFAGSIVSGSLRPNLVLTSYQRRRLVSISLLMLISSDKVTKCVGPP